MKKSKRKQKGAFFFQGKRTKIANMLYRVDFNNIEAVDYIKVTGLTSSSSPEAWLLRWPTPPRNDVKYRSYASLRELCSKQSR